MALTEKYVSSLAAGGGTGLSAGSPLTFSEMVTAINAGTEAGTRFNVKADGTYSRSATDTISGSGTSTSLVVIRGYASTIGDGYLGRTNGNGALITTNMPVLSYASTFQLSTTGGFILLECLRLAGSRNGAVLQCTNNTVAKSCSSSNSSTGVSATAASSSGVPFLAFDSDFSLTGGSGGAAGVSLTGAASSIFACRVSVAQAIPCISFAGGNNRSVAFGNVCYSGGGAGIASTITTNTVQILFNTFVGCAGDGIDIVTGTTGLQCIIGNLVSDNGGYAIDLNSASVAAFMAYNRTRDNTSGAVNGGTDWAAATSYGHVTSGAGTSDFVNAAGNDYRLVATSPAVGAGIPSFASIGALQRPQNSGGGMARGRIQ